MVMLSNVCHMLFLQWLAGLLPSQTFIPALQTLSNLKDKPMSQKLGCICIISLISSFIIFQYFWAILHLHLLGKILLQSIIIHRFYESLVLRETTELPFWNNCLLAVNNQKKRYSICKSALQIFLLFHLAIFHQYLQCSGKFANIFLTLMYNVLVWITHVY